MNMGFRGNQVARVLSEKALGVVVVDTSNEICGDGPVPHRSVGFARRMMVPSLDQQAGVLIEAVQNHTPDVLICDEIGRVEEVEAIHTVHNRGPRLFASAHGNLRGLVANSQLNRLVGGTQTVTLGDAMANKLAGKGKKKETAGKTNGFSKVRTQRCAQPIFNVVVELQPGSLDEWRVVTDVARAVDLILDGGQYNAQVRRRDPTNGRVSVELVRA